MMFSLIVNGIRHYGRINLVVLLAVAISTAVIGGSLIVGDSVRYSLRLMTKQRLGKITDVLHSHRFFREALVEEISKDDAAAGIAKTMAPALLVTGSVEALQEGTNVRRAGSVTLLGVRESGWNLLEHGGIAAPKDGEVILGYRTAAELQVSEGDQVTVWVEVPSSIPRDSLLGERDEVNIEIVLDVAAVIPEETGASRFDLNPGQQLPYNAFLSLTTLQERLGIEEIVVGRRSAVAKPARINAVLAQAATTGSSSEEAAASAELDELIDRHLTIEDVELRLRPIIERGYLVAETDRMILEDSLASAVSAAVDRIGMEASPAIVYLSNEIYAADRTSPDERFTMYSILGGVPFDAPPPLGPFRLSDGSVAPNLERDEILLSKWMADDLEVDVGDRIVAHWHEVGSRGELPEVEKTFTVRGILAADDEASTDQDLTPYVEGMTDVESFEDVDQPFEMDMDRLTERDSDYWDLRRATPKAFVSLENAEELWKSRYGRYTSIRIGPGAGADRFDETQLADVTDRLSFEISRQLNPPELGLKFRPVLAEGLAAAAGANDFTMLFIGFSFFLILSAIILASLMFRLGIQKRISQIGLLNAIGWPPARTERLFILEGTLICLVGSVVGAAAGVAFAKLMIYGLTTWWSSAVGTQYLVLHVQPARLIVAAGISVALAVLVIWLALRSFRNIDLRDQLAGNAEGSETPVAADSSGRWSLVTRCGVGTFMLAIILPSLVILGAVPANEAFGGLSWHIVCFFVAGFSGLSAGLCLLSAALRRRSRRSIIEGTTGGLSGLAIANAARSPVRSILTTALIAFATFVIVAVAAGRRNPLSEIPDVRSGNGGFSLVAESAQPVLFDVNTEYGRKQLGLTGAKSLPSGVRVFSFSMKPGSDASCVNLYQTRVPTMLGAADEFIERGGFRFAGTDDAEWQLLREDFSEGDVPVIPVIGDMNTLKYSLKKSIGDHIAVPNDEEPDYFLRVVGMLDGSVFQGVVIMTDANLKRIDSAIVGSRYFLAETADLSDMDRTATTLETALNDYGLDAEPVSERLAGFLAVQNTYLSTFQILGGLGLLVGTFGLAAVMMRNVVERRREIALMKAVGFTTLRVARLVLMENWVLLFWGILLGTGSALLAMLPHLQSTGADLPWEPLAATLGAVAATGSLASVFAVRAATTLSIRDNLGAE